MGMNHSIEEMHPCKKFNFLFRILNHLLVFRLLSSCAVRLCVYPGILTVILRNVALQS